VRVTVDDPGAFNIPLSATGRCGRVDCSPNGCAHDFLNDEVWQAGFLFNQCTAVNDRTDGGSQCPSNLGRRPDIR
jgi:hypothetical protein